MFQALLNEADHNPVVRRVSRKADILRTATQPSTRWERAIASVFEKWENSTHKPNFLFIIFFILSSLFSVFCKTAKALVAWQTLLLYHGNDGFGRHDEEIDESCAKLLTGVSVDQHVQIDRPWSELIAEHTEIVGTSSNPVASHPINDDSENDPPPGERLVNHLQTWIRRNFCLQKECPHSYSKNSLSSCTITVTRLH